MNAQQVYDIYRKDQLQDMWDYSPLFKDAASGNILEIGVRGGVSSAAFLLGIAERGGHLYSVDINPDCASLYSEYNEWTFILGNSRTDADAIMAKLPPLDILFIDGDHSYEGCKSDLEIYTRRVKRGGLIFVHDVAPTIEITPEMIAHGWFDLSGVRRAYDEFVQQHTWKNEIIPGRFGMGRIVKGK